MNKEGLETPSIYKLALSPKGMTSTLAACKWTGIVFKKFMTQGPRSKVKSGRADN